MTKLDRAFLLLVGDEGALLLPPQRRGPQPALFAPSHDDADATPLLARVAQEPEIPVILLADTPAQTCRHEELPPVSIFDRRKIMARRLARAFPKNELTTALTLPARRALLVALDSKGPVDLWQARLAAMANPSGLCGLLPLESTGLVATLLPEAAHDGWGLLLAAHETGGVRQIVIRDGVFLFTRLTPPINPQASHGFQSATLALDIKATRDYLARFGLTAETPLHLAGIVPESVKTALDVTPLDVASRRLFTPFEAAQRLDLAQAPAPDSATADLIPLLWLATRRTLRAPIVPPHLRTDLRHATHRRIGLSVALAITLAGLLAAMVRVPSLVTLRHEVQTTQAHVQALEAELKTAQAAYGQEARPLERLRRAAQRQRLAVQTVSPLFALLPDLGKALDGKARVTHLRWQDNILHVELEVSAEKSFKNDALLDSSDVLLESLRAALPNRKIKRDGPASQPAEGATLSNKETENKSPSPPLSLTIEAGSP